MNAARTISNFGGNVRFQPAAYFEPRDEAEVIAILNQCRDQQIRVVGSLHAWSDLVVTDGVVLNVTHLQQVELQPDGESAWVGAGCQIKTVLAALKRQGKTLPSLGLITEQTVAGATSTGTHGSGRHCLSQYIQAVRIARFDPVSGAAMVEVIESGDDLRAAKCGLGCLGVIVSLKIQCRPRYSIEEHIQEYQTLEPILQAEEQFPLQQFYLAPWRWTYLGQHRREVPLKRSRLSGLYRIYWFLMIDLGLHLLILFALRIVRSNRFVRFVYRHVIARTVIKNWKVTDESSAMLIMEHELFRHLEIELFVTRDRLEPALNYVREVLTVAANPSARNSVASPSVPDQESLESLRGIYCHHYPICVRRVVSDDMLVSMASGGGQDWYAISLITYARPNERAGFQSVAAFLAQSMSRQFGARPHWGKYCPLPAEELVGLYPEFSEFRRICEQRDPRGRFRNSWMTELFQVSSATRES